MEVNSSLKDNPSLVNTDAFNEGWMIKIKLSPKSEIESLLSAENYASTIG